MVVAVPCTLVASVNYRKCFHLFIVFFNRHMDQTHQKMKRRRILGTTSQPDTCQQQTLDVPSTASTLNVPSTTYRLLSDVIDSRNKHVLQKIDEKQSGKRSDRVKRKTCVNCYEVLVKKFGRQIARKKAKMVITVCNACPGAPGYCLSCFQQVHSLSKNTTQMSAASSSTIQSPELPMVSISLMLCILKIKISI